MKINKIFCLSLLIFYSSFSYAIDRPHILGYFTNWGVYPSTSNFTAANINTDQVDEIMYAFAQVGSCARATKDSQHPLGFATENDPEFCQRNDKIYENGVQDWKLHSSDFTSDFKTEPDGYNWGFGSIGGVLNNKGNKPVLLSIGGWTLSAPIRNAILPENEKAFVQSIIDFINPSTPVDPLYPLANKSDWGNGKFSGIDIDWEPNGNMWTLPNSSEFNKTVTATDLRNYLNFLKDLKAALHEAKTTANPIVKDDIVRVAITANPSVIESINEVLPGFWTELATIVNSVDPMTYDYHGPFDQNKMVGFNAALWNDPTAQSIAGFDSRFSMQGTLISLNNVGVPNEKIVAGIPAYGRGYVVNSIPSKTHPYIPFINSYTPPSGADVLSNRTIYTGFDANNISTGLNFLINLTTDYSAGQNYSWSWANGSEVLVTFDNAVTAHNKMMFAAGKANGIKPLQGIMVWSLDEDVRMGDKDPAQQTDLDLSNASILSGLNAPL